MKYFTLCAVVLCCVIMMTQAVLAADYIDDMTDMYAANFRVADPNLVGVEYKLGDNSYDRRLMVREGDGGNCIGAIHYQMQGARSLSLRIYSPAGTYAYPDSYTALQLGKYYGYQLSPAEALQAMYSPAENNIYVFFSNDWHVLKDIGYLAFSKVSAEFDGSGLINYGVNVYVSAGNAAPKTRLKLTRTSIESNSSTKPALIAENFICDIPPDTSNIWVELNDLGGDILSSNGIRTSLAWVEFSGNIVLGPPPASSSDASGDSGDTTSSPSTNSSSTSANSSYYSSRVSSYSPDYSASSAKASSVPPAASSKFEGVITSSQPAPKNSKVSPSSAPPQSVSSPPPAETASPVQAEPAPPAAAPLVYDIVQENSGKNFRFQAGIIVYIVIVLCLVVYLLIKPNKDT